MGSVRPTARLVEIAERLAVVPVILPGPILVIEGRSHVEIAAACGDVGVASGPSSIPAPPGIAEFRASTLPPGRRVQISDVLAGLMTERGGADLRSEPDFPVLEIPSGRTVGRWSLAPAAAGGSFWHAFPAEGDHDWGCWELVRDDGSSEIVVESTSSALDEAAGQSLIRAPGFVGADVRRGSPAGLLIERLASHAARAGRPIWVPSVDAEAVRFLLSLPGPIWVDGPGVPG